MFRSRSKFDNEAPMSRRGTRVGLVLTVALAMVAVLASTVGVLSSQSTTPSLTFVDVSHATTAFEGGDAYQITYSSSSSAGYALVVDQHSTTTAGFNFAQDIVKDSFKVTPNMGSETTITGLPQTVSIESGTTEIILTFELANDLLVEPNEALVLNITPGSGSSAMGTILLKDPPVVEATFSVSSPINEGDSAEIGITLSEPLTLFHLFNRRTGQSGYTVEEYTGSNFEDISSIAGAAFPGDSNNMRYLRNLGFDFWFYGTQHSDIAVSTNGFVGFTDDLANVEIFTNPTPGNYQEGATPGAGTYDLPTVAPLLSPIAHVNQTPPSSFYGARLGAGTAEDRYIVQYTNAATLVSDPAATPQVRAASTFQVALYASGTIEFRYQTIPTSVLNVSKIGISDGTEMVNTFEEFSYRENNFNGGAQSDVRIVYTPKDSLINAVIKNSAGDTVETVDILENVAVGAQSGSFMVSYPENNDWDGNQVYTVELESAMPLLIAAPSPAPAAVMYTVMDNDSPMVTLERADGISGPISITEGNSVELRARLTNAAAGAPETLTVNLDVGAASTANNNDHNTIPATVTIPATAQVSNSFTVMINDDNRGELEEMLTIEVGDLTYGTPVQTVNKLPTPEKVELTIPLNDKITASVTAMGADEGGMATVEITFDKMLPDTAAAGDVELVLVGTDRADDVTGSPWDITADLKNALSTSVMIPLVDDTLLEGAEKVTVSVRWVAAHNDIFTNAESPEAAFDIGDTDDGRIAIVAPTRTLYNEGDDIMLTVGLASGISTDADIIFEYRISTGRTTDQDGSTRVAADAFDIDGNVNFLRSATILANQQSVAITIALTDDNIAEELEIFEVVLVDVGSSDAALNARLSISPTSATPIISILDNNEPLEYSFRGSGTVSEDSTAYTVRLRRLGMITENVMVAFTVTGSVGSAASAADFVGSSYPTGTFVFTGYDAESAEITLTVADDAVIEGDETFQISLTSRTETHDVRLTDNDQPQVVVELVSGSVPVAEGAAVRLVARLTNAGPSGASEDITVNLARRDPSTGTAGTADDLSTFPSSVVIPRGSSQMTFDVIVNDDDLAEFNETVNIYAKSTDTSVGVGTTNTDSGYDLEITSDDKITVTKIQVEDTDEGAGQARVTITLSQPLPENVSSGALTLNLVNSDRTNDLSGLPADVTDELKRSSATQTPAPVSTVVMVDLTDDDLLEGDELVRLWLQVVSPDLATLMTGANGSFDIIDNEVGMVAIAPVSNTNPDEGDTVEFALTLDLPSGVTTDIPVVVEYEIIDPLGLVMVSASGLGTGFARGLALPVRGLAQMARVVDSETIPAGMKMAVLTIQLAQDATPEETEQLTVRLLSVSTNSAIPLVEVDPDNKEEVIMVLDDENPTYEIIGSGEVDEDDGTYPVRLRRLGRLTHNGMAVNEIQFEIVGEGADEGDFAGPLIRKFTFSPGNALSELISLPLSDDDSEESEKTFQIRVYAPGQIPGQVTPQAAPIVDSSGARFTSVILLDFDVAAFSGLPATGGPVLPVWLLLLLALAGIALLVPTLRRI